MLDEKMTMLDEIRDFLLPVLPLACGSFGRERARTAMLRRLFALGQFFPTLATVRKIPP